MDNQAPPPAAVRKRLNPAITHNILDRILFHHPIGFGVQRYRTANEYFQCMFLDSEWSKNFRSILRTLTHIAVSYGTEGFVVTAPSHQEISFDQVRRQRIEVDDELLDYLLDEVGVQFRSLRITALNIKTFRGKEIFASTIFADNKIEGLENLHLDCYPHNEADEERFYRDAEEIIKRNSTTLRHLSCVTNGNRLVKMLSEEAELETFDVHMNYFPTSNYSLGDLVPLLECPAKTIHIWIDACFAGFEYSASGASRCKRLSITKTLQDDQDRELVDVKELISCVADVCPSMDSFEVALQGFEVNENSFDDLFSPVDTTIQSYVSLFRDSPLKCSATCRITFSDATSFRTRFDASYPVISDGGREQSTDVEEATSWIFDRTVQTADNQCVKVLLYLDKQEISPNTRRMFSHPPRNYSDEDEDEDLDDYYDYLEYYSDDEVLP
ncbi:hypothetical protein AAVH_01120 [Aphelenchoides avenae]|nr:hypothetical protein AAVH_01120 [Aphelenchus avenae]